MTAEVLTKEQMFEKARGVGLSQEEIDRVYAEAIATAKGRGDENPEPRALGILKTSLKRKISLGADYLAVVLGANTTDYGVSNFFSTTVAKWEDADDELRRQMVANKEVSEQGKPLYQKGFAKGKIIDNPEGNFEQQVHFFGRKADEQQFKHGRFHVRDYRNITLAPFRKLRVKAEARRSQTALLYDLNITGAGAVEVLDSKEIMMGDTVVNGARQVGFIRKFLSDRLVQLADLEDFLSKHESRDDRLVVVECNVVSIDEGRPNTPSDIMLVDDLSLGLGDGVLGVTCWLPKDMPRDFHIDSKSIFVFATVGTSNRDGSIVLNVLSVWTPESERVRVTPKPLASAQMQERIEPARAETKSSTQVIQQPLAARVPTAEQPF